MSELSGPALRTFLNIARRWKMTDEQRLRTLDLNERAQLEALAFGDEKLSADGLKRTSYVFGIFRAINTLLPVPERADGWIGAADTAPVFGGRKPLDLITSGNVSNLHSVRMYLDAQVDDASVDEKSWELGHDIR